MRRFDPKSKQWSPFLEGISADGLEYSRDGKWIIYVNYPEEQLWRAKADGSQKLQLTTSPNLICLPRWSPDGTQILLMYRHPPEPWKMGVIDRDGGELKPLISGEGTETDPNWSPDGTRIVYCSSDYQELSGLCIFDIQRNTVETVPGSQNLFSPRWSPDGRYIVAISSAKEYYGHLWLFDLEKKKWSPLTSMVSGFPLWSKDGKFVHYGDQLPFTGHFRVRIQDGKVERISELAGMKKIGNLGGWDGLTPEGDPLILHDTGHTEVYALEVEP
jgi:Tol biopolymer transport system component